MWLMWPKGKNLKELPGILNQKLEVNSLICRYSSLCKENFGVGPNALFTWWKTWNMHQTNINIQVTNVFSTRKPRTKTNLDFCGKKQKHILKSISAFQLGILIIAAGNSAWLPLFLLSPVSIMNHHILFTSHKCFIFKEW